MSQDDDRKSIFVTGDPRNAMTAKGFGLFSPNPAEAAEVVRRGRDEMAGAARFARLTAATQEASWKFEPLKLVKEASKVIAKPWGECVEDGWANERYTVNRRRFAAGWHVGNAPWIQLGIANVDGSARHDWRDFQRIKNQLAGAEWSAVEMYPPESRLCDPSNYFILWCAPDDAQPFGLVSGRLVKSSSDCLAPQRPWAAGDEPKELRAEE